MYIAEQKGKAKNKNFGSMQRANCEAACMDPTCFFHLLATAEPLC